MVCSILFFATAGTLFNFSAHCVTLFFLADCKDIGAWGDIVVKALRY